MPRALIKTAGKMLQPPADNAGLQQHLCCLCCELCDATEDDIVTTVRELAADVRCVLVMVMGCEVPILHPCAATGALPDGVPHHL